MFKKKRETLHPGGSLTKQRHLPPEVPQVCYSHPPAQGIMMFPKGQDSQGLPEVEKRRQRTNWQADWNSVALSCSRVFQDKN